MKSCGRVRESDSKTPERKGWVLLMHDAPEFNGIDAPSTDVFFFELTWKEFFREIREDVDSFFGYLDGCPEEPRSSIEKYKAMWKAIKAKKEFDENGRRIEMVMGTAVVREK